MTMHSKTPTIAYIPWLNINLDIVIVIYLKIFSFLSSLLQYISAFWCMKRNAYKRRVAI